MHLGSIYLISNDFEKSVDFYEKLLNMPVTSMNMTRFAQFVFEGHNISIMNAHFDTENPDKVVHKGEETDICKNMETAAAAPNAHKFVLNFWVEDLRSEYKKLKSLNISEKLTKVKYVCNVSPYYYFQLTDPDDNIIEVTGDYTPEKDEFGE